MAGIAGGLDGTAVLVQVDVAEACSRAGYESRSMGGLRTRYSGQLSSGLELVGAAMLLKLMTPVMPFGELPELSSEVLR